MKWDAFLTTVVDKLKPIELVKYVQRAQHKISEDLCSSLFLLA